MALIAAGLVSIRTIANVTLEEHQVRLRPALFIMSPSLILTLLSVLCCWRTGYGVRYGF
jgi:hypothetical protein